MKQHKNPSATGIKIAVVSPKTPGQKVFFDAYDAGKHLFCKGVAGTGKSYLALGLALRDVLNYKSQSRVVLVRSIVPSRDIGHLPGNLQEKCEIYEAPYRAIVAELAERGDAYDTLKTRGVIQFITTSHLRGMTLNNAIIIVDEAQNFSLHESDSIITRVGQNSRIVFLGDAKQTDLPSRERQGFAIFEQILARIPDFEIIKFGIDDIVRSDLVGKYLRARATF